jgi:glycosyltransferase involved in cell wall biosynthesis
MIPAISVIGGGSTVARNVISRLPGFFEVIYIPPIRNSLEFDYEDRLAYVNALRGLKAKGLHTPEAVLNFFESELESLSARERVLRYSRVVEREAARADFLFDPEYFPFNMLSKYIIKSIPVAYRLSDSYALAKRAGKKAFVLLMGLSDIERPTPLAATLNSVRYNRGLHGNPASVVKLAAFEAIARVYAHNLRKSWCAGAFFLSEGQLYALGLNGCAKCVVLHPPVAVSPELLSHRKASRQKGNKVIFFTRLVKGKGIFELPSIFAAISKRMDVEFLVAGRFFTNGDKIAFFELLKKKGLASKVKYLGYLTSEQLYEHVSSSKLMVYPSHSDSYPLVVLEALALGTPVIAYDIPGPYSAYHGLPGVTFVREFDIKAIAEKAIEVLEMSDSEYDAMMNDQRLQEFLAAHTSWDNVVKALVAHMMETVV